MLPVNESSKSTHRPHSSAAWPHDDNMETNLTPVPDEEAFAAIKAGIDTLPPSMKVFLNSGRWALFNTVRPVTLNLHVLLQPSSIVTTWALRIWNARFFEKFPEYADRTFLSVKNVD